MGQKGHVPKKFKELYWNILFGNGRELKYEDRQIIVTGLILSILSFMSAFVNKGLGLDKVMYYVPLLFSVVFFSFFLIGRFRKLNKLLYGLVSLSLLIFLNLIWYYNYGTRSSVLSYFIVVVAFFIYIWNIREVILLIILVSVNIIVLMLLEYNDPYIVGEYSSERVRVLDVYFGLSISLLLMIIFSFWIKINYLKEYKKALKADQLKSSFLANLSHEIRTPLNAIVGFSSLLVQEEETLMPEEKENFKVIIEENSEYLAELIESIIGLSKIEVDEMELNCSETNLTALFERLKIYALKLAFKNNRDLKIDFELSVKDPVIVTDISKLELVLKNLISNGIKFTREGSVIFGCGEKGDMLTFYVKDTGIGIREEDMECIFDRFVKLDIISTEFSRGTGIGLYLSRELVKNLGGRLWVNSQYGIGSTFYFRIGSNIS